MSSIAAAWKPWATKTSCAARSSWTRRAPRGNREVRRAGRAGVLRGCCMTPGMLPPSCACHIPQLRSATGRRAGRVTVAVVPGPRRPVHLVGNSLGGLVSLLVAARRPELVASLSLVSPAMPVHRVPPTMDRAVALLLVPGIASVAERRLAGIPPEVTVRGLLEMCFGDPSRVAPERLEQALAELRERAEQPWADRALVRTMRGLMTSYLRVGRSAA